MVTKILWYQEANEGEDDWWCVDYIEVNGGLQFVSNPYTPCF